MSNEEKIFKELEEIKRLLSAKQNSELIGDWITEERAMQLLRIGKTSIWKLRKKDLLVCTSTRPIFYSLSSIQAYLDDNKNKSENITEK